MTQKKIHRFYIPEVSQESQFTLTDEALTRQIMSVLRLREGELISLFQGTDEEYTVKIVSIEKHRIVVEHVSRTKVPQPTRTLIAAVSIVKRDLFEVIVQKLTELGVSMIVPVLSGRTVKQSVRLDRLQIISNEALEQCGGTKRVTITEPMTLTTCLESFPYPAIVFAPGAHGDISLSEETVVMYVGPEGGWSEEDEKLFLEHAAQMMTLGPRILRTETAAIVGAYTLLWK